MATKAGKTEETSPSNTEQGNDSKNKEKVPSPSVSSLVAGKVIVCSNIDQWNDCLKKQKVLAFFGVPSDGRVVQIYPTIKDLAARYPNVCVVQLDFNKLKLAADKMGVKSTPALVFIEEGKKKDILDDVTKKKLEDMENKF